MNLRIGSRAISRAFQRGLSLIELMIAMSISALLILGLVEIFSSTRAAFAASEALGRIQENSRFAMEFVRRDTRMAGHMGCMNEFAHVATPLEDPRWTNRLMSPLVIAAPGGPAQIAAAYEAALAPMHPAMRADMPIQVFEFTGTSPGDALAIADPNPSGATNLTSWSPALPATLQLVNPGGATTFNTILPGSDVLVVRYFDEAPTLLPQFNASGENWALGEGGVNVATSAVYTGALSSSFPLNHIYGMTNCRRASMFQMVGAVAPNVLTAVGGVNRSPWNAQEVYGLGTMIFRYRVAIYYIGRGTNGPSLFRKSLRANPANPTDAETWETPEELIEGVESMQLLLATADAPTADGRVDDVTGYQTAATLLTGITTELGRAEALRRIASVRVSLLMRSPDAASGVDPVIPTVVVGDVIVTPPLDRRLRHVYESIIQLRNRQRA